MLFLLILLIQINSYDRSTAAKAVNKVEVTGDMEAEDILKLALKHLL